MTEPSVSLIPVRAAELAVGKSLPKPIYDRQGKLLLASGRVIESQSQLEGLVDHGYIKEVARDLRPAQPKNHLLISSGRKLDSAQDTSTTDTNKEVIAAMDDVRWYVGETLYLQVIDNPAARYTVKMIGFVKGKTVLVTAPETDGKLEFIREGQTFIVRSFSGKKAHAFVSAAVKSVLTPHPYLHLTYPKEVRSTVIRRGVRAEVKIAASVSVAGSSDFVSALLNDLSTGGASCVAKQALGEKGNECRLKFSVQAAGQDEDLALKATLRSLAPSENGEGFKHGFEFLDLSVRDRLILSAFVHQTLAERD